MQQKAFDLYLTSQRICPVECDLVFSDYYLVLILMGHQLIVFKETVSSAFGFALLVKTFEWTVEDPL